MNEDGSGGDIGLRQSIPATWTFFRQWVRHPLSTASVAPSGRQLTRAMMRQLPSDAHCVVELGAGTGVFTRALLEHGIAPRDLLVVELNAELHALLHRRFPQVAIVNGDARDLRAIVARAHCEQPVDAVVSGLGLLAMPRGVQKQILDAVFAVLGPGRSLIQFSYAPAVPVANGLLDDLGLRAERVAFAPFNLPPAFVFKFSRRQG
ncbi:MAG: methyltransferase domain-containing protein [Dokdonella sp.]|uniref:class I SAM-dependent methyltransferase n=1 Tax=Dokdonella sp. TaxID=2291710 RepID=UPI0025BDC70F|nr:methyltransferase domain-containing protein [Dokdonella sp.]MBX3700590.1 methyltransferase domain-containing protein [Dokdonella sp.]MCW5579256.1 methyltransferase domain-containing protein [Dokdonella sp.]